MTCRRPLLWACQTRVRREGEAQPLEVGRKAAEAGPDGFAQHAVEPVALVRGKPRARGIPLQAEATQERQGAAAEEASM